MAIYKISYVVPDKTHPGGIINLKHHPKLGEIITIGNVKYRVREVIELIPPQGKFHYLHVTCTIVD
jgi:hypothetical protein